jgi:ABC-type multidrug transport system fused ATPase/permease subunit
MHPILAIIFFAWLSMHFILCMVFCTKAANYSSIQSGARAIVQGKIVDVISNYLNVKIFTGYQYESKNILSAQQDEVKKYKFSLLYIEKFKLLLSLISIINVAVLFYFAIKLWQDGELTAGDIVFAVNSTVNLMTTMWFAGDEISYVISEIGICKQSLAIIQDPIEFAESNYTQELKISSGSIKFDAVTFNYQHNDNLFKNQTIFIPGKQKVGLVGFSGSGKTTFTSLIMRLYEVTDGIIKIDEQDISKISLDSLRSKISFVPQEPVQFQYYGYKHLDVLLPQFLQPHLYVKNQE